ncbi:MAG: glycosyltransferase [Proteobacteria bacterium]|nr:glycosyltransferase [Pseudomonadota bacterium]
MGQYYSDPAVQHCLDELLRNSSVVIVNSNPLKKFLEYTFGAELPVVEIPPGFDFDLVPDTPRHANACPGFVIGYSGTHRASAFDVVSDAIEIILKEYPGHVHFEFIGYCPERLLGSPGVTFFPNIPDYRQFLLFNASRKWSLGLAPLADNVFTRAKTNNKFREYGALGIPGLYSDTTPYRESVDHAVNGLLCGNSAEEWAEGMRRALNSPKLLKAISENAFDTVRRLHNNKNIFPLWESTLHVAKVTPVTIGIAASTTWYLSFFVSTQRLRMSAYAAMLREGGAMALLTHVLRRAGEILRLP